VLHGDSCGREALPGVYIDAVRVMWSVGGRNAVNVVHDQNVYRDSARLQL